MAECPQASSPQPSGSRSSTDAQSNGPAEPAVDRHLDPVAQALAAVRAAGGTPVNKLPQVASKRELRKTPGQRRRVTKRPTGLDGRADRSWRDPRPVGELLKPAVGKFGWADNFAVGTIMNNWEMIVGPTVADHARPLKFDRNKRTLVVQCTSTAWASNLRFLKPQILEAIGRLASSEVIRELDILGPNVGPVAKGRFRVKGRGPRDDYG